MLRSNTAYRLARSIVDGFTLAQAILAVIGVAGTVVFESRLEEPNCYLLAGVLCGAFVISVAAFLQREFLHAIFDIADVSLQQSNPLSEEEDPFKD